MSQTERFGDSLLLRAEALYLASLRTDQVARLAMMRQLAEELATLSEPPQLVFIIREEAGKPNADDRRQVTEILGQLLARSRCLVMLVEGTGIASSAKRTLIRLLATALRGSRKLVVVSNTLELEDAISSDGGGRAVTRLRAALEHVNGEETS